MCGQVFVHVSMGKFTQIAYIIMHNHKK